MTVSRASFSLGCSLALTILSLCGTSAIAQQNKEKSTDEKEVIEEMVITADKKSGDPVDVRTLYEEKLRARLLREQERLRIDKEENEWRKSGSRTLDSSNRMQWGYSPQDDLRMHREIDLPDTQPETVSPATIFRVGF